MLAQPGLARRAGASAGLVGIVGALDDEPSSAGALGTQGERGRERIDPDGVVQGHAVVGLQPIHETDDPVIPAGAAALTGQGDAV